MEDAAAAAMVDSLGDRWSYYMTKADYAAYMEQMTNSYVGVGMIVQLNEEGYVTNLRVEEGGPAKEAGVQAGDTLIAVEGQDIKGLDIDETKNRVRGEEGTRVSVTVLREGKELTLEVERRLVETQVAKGQMLEGSVGLVTIVNFDSRCAEESIAAIEALVSQGATALIFDVRNNPGGYKHELVKLLNYLLPQGDLFRSLSYDGKSTVDTSDAGCLELPMAVLINGNSYSAAEFFAAALEEYDWAITVGQPTTGKGYFQSTYQLSDGSAAALSIGKYFTPNGVSLAEVGGLVPTIVVEVDEDTGALIYGDLLDPSEDPQIQAAVAHLTGKK
jgi:carboxyl-terminal processing protease